MIVSPWPGSWPLCNRYWASREPIVWAPTTPMKPILTGPAPTGLGLVADMMMRTYYESQSKTTYLLGEVREEAIRDAIGVAEHRAGSS